VARSEYQHSARNAAIAYLMKAYGNFENEVDKVLQSYFNACAIRMSCVDLARAFIYLANRGVPLGATTPLLPARTTKQVNALLATCGLYDEAGDFAYRVGMPGKSSVSGRPSSTRRATRWRARRRWNCWPSVWAAPFFNLVTLNREITMKRIMSLLRATLATLLLWHALPTLAAELPPLSLADANAKQAVILDTRASYFYQGWPMEGEQQGGHVVEEWPAALATKGLKADRPVALYGAPREVAEVARLLRQQGIKQLFELQGWKTAPREHLARWQQLVYPRWLADLQEGKPVVAAPKGDWKLFEVAWGSPKAYLQPAGRGAAVEQGL